MTLDEIEEIGLWCSAIAAIAFVLSLLLNYFHSIVASAEQRLWVAQTGSPLSGYTSRTFSRKLRSVSDAVIKPEGLSTPARSRDPARHCR
jgi:hypothetical protein